METSSNLTAEQIRSTVWEMLNQHQSINGLRDRVDSATFSQISAAAAQLNAQFTAIESEVLAELDLIPAELNEDEKREFIKVSAHADTLLRILNNEPHAPLIWRTIKPAD